MHVRRCTYTYIHSHTDTLRFVLGLTRIYTTKYFFTPSADYQLSLPFPNRLQWKSLSWKSLVQQELTLHSLWFGCKTSTRSKGSDKGPLHTTAFLGMYFVINECSAVQIRLGDSCLLLAKSMYTYLSTMIRWFVPLVWIWHRKNSSSLALMCILHGESAQIKHFLKSVLALQ